MILTNEMNKILDIVKHTNDHVFVTGKAGSGKTTFLKYLIANAGKKCVVTAPTGIAAINAGGVTLHSLFNLPLHPISPKSETDYRFTKYKLDLLNKIELLIIDEVSMVRPDILDAIDRKLRYVRESQETFGGVQVVMFGDLFQLPPVIKKEESKILDKFYYDYFFFNALVWRNAGFHIVELKQVFRQSNPEFIDVLNHIRNYQVTSEELDLLSETKDRIASQDFDSDYIHICTHRADVDAINKEKLGEDGLTTYSATIEDKFPETSAPCDMNLKLRVGARVMCLVNDNIKGVYNGMLGLVVAMDDKFVTVKMDRGVTIKFERYTWYNTKFSLKDEKVVKESIGSCSQFPLTLAWAITIHKSQGLTFDKVVIHVSHTFCPGQLYVALSRCRTLEGIISDAFITKQMIIPEYALTDFERTYHKNDNYYGKRVKQ